MKKLIPRSVRVFLAFLIFSAAMSPTFAKKPRVTVFYYSAKFVCGKSGGQFLSPGQYFTNINVYHSNLQNRTALIKRFAVALPEQPSGRPIRFIGKILEGGEATMIDCDNIYRNTELPAGSLVEGFVVIYSLTELEVVPIYTAGHTEVEIFKMERAPARVLKLASDDPVVEKLVRELNLQ